MNILSHTRGICCRNVGRLRISPHRRASEATATIIARRSHSTSQWKKYQSILKVDKQSSTKDIKDSFLRLSKLYHPDNKVTGSHTKFVELKEAYDALKDGQPKPTTSSYPTNSNNYYDSDLSHAAHRRYRDRYRDYQTAYERGYGFGGPHKNSSTPWEDFTRDKEYRRQRYNPDSFSRGRPLISLTLVLSVIAWIVIYSGALLFFDYNHSVKKGMLRYRTNSYEDYNAYKEYLKKKEAAKILSLKKLKDELEEHPLHKREAAEEIIQP